MSVLYNFNPDQPYRLIRVTDKKGADKVLTDSLYRERINCIANQLCFDAFETYGGYRRLRMVFVEDEKGNPIHRNLHTSSVLNVEEKDDEIHVYTRNSIYIFKKAKLTPKKYIQDACNMIELYMSSAENHFFARGVYYDDDKQIFELKKWVNSGMIQDSVLLDMEDIVEDTEGDIVVDKTVARYFPTANEIMFYDNLCDRRDNAIPLLIHNTGSENIVVKFQFYHNQWTIIPGQTAWVIPYSPDGADPREDGIDDYEWLKEFE